ncbi:MAG: methyltransferase domain-containing protein [Armatimonadetes bacterium]|nr:methyltransferase domain-containing protein [Armatimonadota bacterium]
MPSPEHPPGHRDRYIPALSLDWLTPLYDPLIRWTTREFTFKPRLIQQARIQPGHRVLDLGCGTATLAILIKKAHPDAEVVGLDGDPKVLEIARAKITRARLAVALDRGMAFDLPYRDGSFDRVFASLLFHHLTREDKQRTAREVFRILRPGGELHVADLGPPDGALMALISLVMRRLEEAGDTIGGLLPGMFRDAGLDEVVEPARFRTVFGTLRLYRARKPG